MNLRDEFIKKLIEAKISSPRLETDIILKNSMPLYPNYTDEQETIAREYLSRRLNHEPLDKIIGKKEFYKYTFKVDNNVLTPRPDTEILVEKAICLIDDNKKYKLIDLGTGSGCIVLSILKEKHNVNAIGLDISDKALNIAKQNAKLLEVEDRITFINGDWNDIVKDNEEFDIIVSNPPYIPEYEYNKLDIEVKKFDPITALVGGDDGLKCYREIADIASIILKKGGYILLEVGYNQAFEVIDIFSKKDFSIVEIAKDLSDINRCIILKK